MMDGGGKGGDQGGDQDGVSSRGGKYCSAFNLRMLRGLCGEIRKGGRSVCLDCGSRCICRCE